MKIIGILFLVLGLISAVVTVAQESSIPIRFICTDGEWDYWWLDTTVFEWQDDVDNTYPDQNPMLPVREPIVRTHAGSGGMLVWYGEGNSVSSVWIEPGDRECGEGSGGPPNRHDYAGVECAGAALVLPELAGQSFYVDGQEYHVNEDGTLSWVVPETAIWSWLLFDSEGNRIAVLSQTEPGNCSVTEVYAINRDN